MMFVCSADDSSDGGDDDNQVSQTLIDLESEDLNETGLISPASLVEPGRVFFYIIWLEYTLGFGHILAWIFRRHVIRKIEFTFSLLLADNQRASRTVTSEPGSGTSNHSNPVAGGSGSGGARTPAQQRRTPPVNGSREASRAAPAGGGTGTSAYRIPRKSDSSKTREEPAKKKKKTDGKEKEDKRKGDKGRDDKRKDDKGNDGKGKKKKKSKKEEDTGKKKRTGKKQKKSKKDSSGSSSGSSSDSESSSEDSDSSSSSSSSGESSEGNASDTGRKRKKNSEKRKIMCREDWNTSVELWPLEDRPSYLQSRHGSAGRMKLEKLLAIGERHDKREEKMGAGKAVFAKDQKQRKVRYKKFTDDGVRRLHVARFNGLPTGDPQDWAAKVPVKRDQVMKNLYMTHYGMAQGHVDSKTIVKVRKSPILIWYLVMVLNTE